MTSKEVLNLLVIKLINLILNMDSELNRYNCSVKITTKEGQQKYYSCQVIADRDYTAMKKAENMAMMQPYVIGAVCIKCNRVGKV